jgi:hypothetical protein
MAPEKRNAYVVLSLIAAMTVGVAGLRSLELLLVPRSPDKSANTMLMASSGRPVDVIVSYARSEDEIGSVAAEPDESICLLYPDQGRPLGWEERGPRVRLVVVGSDGDQLNHDQKERLLGALASINDSVAVRFATDSGEEKSGSLPAQAEDLRKFLVRKGFIR